MRQAELARSEPELLGALQFTYVGISLGVTFYATQYADTTLHTKATKAQLDFMNNYPEMVPQLTQIAHTMM